MGVLGASSAGEVLLRVSAWPRNSCIINFITNVGPLDPGAAPRPRLFLIDRLLAGLPPVRHRLGPPLDLLPEIEQVYAPRDVKRVAEDPAWIAPAYFGEVLEQKASLRTSQDQPDEKPVVAPRLLEKTGQGHFLVHGPPQLPSGHGRGPAGGPERHDVAESSAKVARRLEQVGEGVGVLPHYLGLGALGDEVEPAAGVLPGGHVP